MFAFSGFTKFSFYIKNKKCVCILKQITSFFHLNLNSKLVFENRTKVVIFITGGFVGSLAEEGCYLLLPHGKVSGVPETRERLSGGDEGVVSEETNSMTIIVVHVLKHFIELIS